MQIMATADVAVTTTTEATTDAAMEANMGMMVGGIAIGK
jgi:hypothetical protein